MTEEQQTPTIPIAPHIADAGLQDDIGGFAANGPIVPTGPVIGVRLAGAFLDAAKSVANDLMKPILPPRPQ